MPSTISWRARSSWPARAAIAPGCSSGTGGSRASRNEAAIAKSGGPAAVLRALPPLGLWPDVLGADRDCRRPLHRPHAHALRAARRSRRRPQPERSLGLPPGTCSCRARALAAKRLPALGSPRRRAVRDPHGALRADATALDERPAPDCPDARPPSPRARRSHLRSRRVPAHSSAGCVRVTAPTYSTELGPHSLRARTTSVTITRHADLRSECGLQQFDVGASAVIAMPPATSTRGPRSRARRSLARRRSISRAPTRTESSPCSPSGRGSARADHRLRRERCGSE